MGEITSTQEQNYWSESLEIYPIQPTLPKVKLWRLFQELASATLPRGGSVNSRVTSGFAVYWKWIWISQVAQWLKKKKKKSTYSAENPGDTGLIPVLGRSPGGGHGNPVQSVFLRGEFHGQRSLLSYTVHGVAKNQTQLKWLSTHAWKWICLPWLLLECPVTLDMWYSFHSCIPHSWHFGAFSLSQVQWKHWRYRHSGLTKLNNWGPKVSLKS